MPNHLDPEKSDRRNLHRDSARAASGQLKPRRQRSSSGMIFLSAKPIA
jgi:hypothetical protein